MRTPLTDYVAVKAWEAKRKSDKEPSLYWEGYIAALRNVCEFMEEEIKNEKI